LVSHQIHQLSASSLEEARISYPQYRILMGLYFCEWAGKCDGLNPSQISDQQGTSRNTVSALIRGLEDQGLVERYLDQADRRRFNIHLTEAGRRLIINQAGRHAQMINNLFSALSADESELLRNLLRILNRRAKTIKE
jgi:DNA-binding MarR family transcriptional regulator